jgi:hypothetical protein
MDEYLLVMRLYSMVVMMKRMMRRVPVVEMMNVNEILEYNHQLKVLKLYFLCLI